VLGTVYITIDVGGENSWFLPRIVTILVSVSMERALGVQGEILRWKITIASYLDLCPVSLLFLKVEV
jgi:hypothetical protein